MKLLVLDRRIRLWCVLLGLLSVTDVWTWSALEASRQRTMEAQQSAGQCLQLASQITRLRSEPSVASAQELQTTELASRMEQAARTAQIPAAGLMRISPLSPRRVGDSAYMERPTNLQVRLVTLQQLMTFLRELTNGSTGLRATSLRLSAPREQPSGPQWNVELTLSYLLYSPRTPEPAGRPQP